MTSSRILAASAVLFAGTAGAQCPIATVTPSTVANPSVTQAYSTTFGVSVPGTYQFEGQNLPPGLSLAADGTLSGTPGGVGTAFSRIVATNAAGCVVSRSLPIVVDAAACVNLALGAVQLLDQTQASTFCVAPSAAASEYTLIPVDTEATTNLSLSITGTGIVPVVGPPTPRPAETGGLAPLAELDADAPVGAQVPASDLPSIATPQDRARHLVSPNGTPGTPLVVGQLIDIQVAPGCSGAPDMRKGRVEAVSPVETPAKPRLYMVQEVVEEPVGSGTWNPAVVGSLVRLDYEVLLNAFDGLPPDMTPPASGTLGTMARTAARDTLIDNLGDPTDLDDNGGTIVFFTRAVNELSPPASSGLANAVFESRDLFSSAPGSCPRSNEGEYVYMLMADPTGQVNSNVRTVSFVFGNAVRSLTHQMTHLVATARRLYVTLASNTEEPWLSEGLAWSMEELLFFNTSVGLAPRNNIALADLTTGPNASRRVAAFNTYINPRFGVQRGFYLQNPAVTGVTARVGPLRRSPFAGTTGVNLHEQIVNQYGITSVFLRYAVDRLAGTDATFFRALVNSPNVGLVNLNAALGGADADAWSRDFAIAAYSDDAVTNNVAPYTNPSWNYRSVFGGLGGYPLVTLPLTDGAVATTLYGAGGGPRWARFGIPAAATQPAIFNLESSPSAPLPPTVKTAIIRTK
jgi:hypothetical protein